MQKPHPLEPGGMTHRPPLRSQSGDTAERDRAARIVEILTNPAALDGFLSLLCGRHSVEAALTQALLREN